MDNYKNKYDAALKRARELSKTVTGANYEYIFPELKEPEDEKVRKALIELVKFAKGSCLEILDKPFNVVSMDAMLAWLEKQKNTLDKEYVFRPLAGDTIENAAGEAVKLNGKVVLAFNGAYIPISNKTKDEIVAEYYDWIKKQSEQTHMTKTSDKELEPKFKVDDWVVSNNDGEVWQIGSIYYVTGQCCFLYNKNRDRIGVTKEELDSDFHLWTIKDAKEGDVLVDSYSKDSILILYKGIDKERSILAHCGWNGYNLFVPSDGLGYGELDNTDYLPATKEQRDLLFQKMKQAGFEWDAEKKELRGQILKITPKFCVGQLITDNNGTWYNITNIKCLDDWYYEVYDIVENSTHLELCSIIDEKFRENRFADEIKKMLGN